MIKPNFVIRLFILLCSDVPGKMCVGLAMQFFCRMRVEYCEEDPQNQSSLPLVRAIGKNALDSTVIHCTALAHSLCKAGMAAALT